MSSPYVYALNRPTSFIDKDGELPIFIGGRVSKDSERNRKDYWDAQILSTIAGSGIPNPGNTALMVDGDRGLSTDYTGYDGGPSRLMNNLSSDPQRRF